MSNKTEKRDDQKVQRELKRQEDLPRDHRGEATINSGDIKQHDQEQGGGGGGRGGGGRKKGHDERRDGNQIPD